MAIVAAYLYRNGQRVRPVDLDEGFKCANDKSEFVWIGLTHPTAEELEMLKVRFNLHPLAVEDALKAHQLPKVDTYRDQLFVVARTAHMASGRIEYGETAMFVGQNHIITIRHGSARAHTALRSELEANPDLLSHGVDYVLHAILDFIVDGYAPIIDGIENEVLGMEQNTVDHFLGRAEITRIFTLRRELIRFQRVLVPMAEVVHKFTRVDLPCIDTEARPYFSDVLDHVRRVQMIVDDLREALNSVFEFSNLLEQQRTGAITRQLAAWAAILAVPTAVAGIYGMNFENMPELKTHYGYFIVLAVIAAICIWLFIRFKRLRWL